MKAGIQCCPALGPGPHQIPEAAATQLIFSNQVQLRQKAPGILKPHLTLLAALICIAEPGALGFLIILNFRTVLYGQGHRFLIGERLGSGYALLK